MKPQKRQVPDVGTYRLKTFGACRNLTVAAGVRGLFNFTHNSVYFSHFLLHGEQQHHTDNEEDGQRQHA